MCLLQDQQRAGGHLRLRLHVGRAEHNGAPAHLRAALPPDGPARAGERQRSVWNVRANGDKHWPHGGVSTAPVCMVTCHVTVATV